MQYDIWRRARDDSRRQGLVLRLVETAEMLDDTAASRQQLAAAFAEAGFSSRVWDALLGNAVKLRGVRRMSRQHPYATHPTRMAWTCYDVLPPGPERDDAAVVALLHDYLEEGDGHSVASVAAMRGRFPREPRAVLSAVVLSEPLVDYAQFHDGSDADLHQWRRVAYIAQAVAAVQALAERSFADAALADKLDNLHDLDYLTQARRQSDAQLHRRLARRLSYFRVVQAELAPWASTALSELLAAALAARQAELGVPEALVEQGAAELRRRLAHERDALSAMIGAYHQHLGVALT